MFWIRKATKEDQNAIFSLIERAGLSTKGIREEKNLFLVVEQIEDNHLQLVGTAGLSFYGKVGLFRSLVLEQAARCERVIFQLIEALLNAAKEAELERVFLIASQQAEWLEAFSFSPISHEEVPEEIGNSIHFQTISEQGVIFACSLSSIVNKSYNELSK